MTRETLVPAAITTPSAEPTGFGILTRGLSTDQTLRGLLCVGLFVCGALLVMQDDSWWHLRCGQLISQLGTVPQHDSFSFSLPEGTYWPNHEWLAQVLMYRAYTLGGLPLVSLAAGVVVALVGLALCGALAGGMERRFVLLLLVLPWIVASLSARPQIFTLLGMAVTLWLLARERYWALPVVFLGWANLHGAVSLGGLLLVGCCAAALLFDRSRLTRLVVVTGLCGGATLVTPMGIKLLLFPLESVARLKQLDLEEWTAPGFTQWMHLYFWGLLAAVAVSLLLARRRLNDWPSRMFLLPCVLFAVLAALSQRNIPLFLMVAAAAVSRALPAGREKDTAHDFQKKNLGALAAFGVLATLSIGLAYRLPWDRLEWEPLSAEALAAVRNCPQPMFNTYNTGGYLLWFAPERKVFLDSRQDPYPIELLLQTQRAQQLGDYEELFARFGFRSAVMEPTWPLGRKLIESGWKITHRDDRWLVLVREG